MIIDRQECFKKIAENLSEKPTEQRIFNSFLKLYPTEWKQLKIIYSKFNRSKQFGNSIPMPKPEVSLRKEIKIWLQKK